MKTQIKHFDLYGKRNHKYDFLLNNNIKSINWNELNPTQPNHFFTNKNFDEIKVYEKGFKVDELFVLNSVGVSSFNDNIAVHFDESSLKEIINSFKSSKNVIELRIKYKIKDDSRDWKIKDAINSLQRNDNFLGKIYYRPFDTRYTLHQLKSKGFISYPRPELVKNLVLNDNFSLNIVRQSTREKSINSIITKQIICRDSITSKTYAFPLYLYPDQGEQGELIEQHRTPNLNMEIVKEIEKVLGLVFSSEKEATPSFGHPSKGGELEEDSLKNNPLTNNYQTKNSPPDGGVAASADGVVLSKENEILTTINNIQIIKRAVHELPHNPKLRQLAIEKRKEGILSEVLFWKQVHKGKFHNIDFDRQRVIGSYIVDFYVKNLGLVVEIDGASHDNKGEYDEAREGYLKSLGLKIFKTYDKDIKKNIHWVMKRLEDFIIEEFGEMPTPSASRHPSEGGELEEVSLKNNPLTNNYQTKNSPPDGGVAASADGVVQNTFAPIDLLDYIYAVLHSPAYREKYKEFLKIDFPRVPYPNIKSFWKLVELGKKIREIHLLESPVVEDYITKYPIGGNNIVEKVSYKDGNVYINSEQFFEGVPEVAWNFYIGGYQPAQKWLKDRKDRELNFDDIMHYQKIIVALTETDKLMKEIDKIEVE